MIEDKQAEKASAFIRDNAKIFGKARAERIYLEEYRKTQKALLMNEAAGTDKTREAKAYADPKYVTNLKGIRAAREIEETLRWEMVAAQARIEIWRSQSANNRNQDRAHQ
jgi:predicted acyltransferase (DUF342 family)